MPHEITLWVLTSAILLVLVAITIIRRFRKETGNNRKLMEWNSDDPIHYEQDEDDI